MIHSCHIAFLLSFLFIVWTNFPAAGQTNRALLIAIDQYPAESGWTDIHATNDIKLLLPVLKQNGYKSRNITILENQSATKSNIAGQLKRLCKEAEKGDRIYFHFSGHGQLMFDDNGDEQDGLDEALIPYDACRRFLKKKYEGEKHLRDDELEVLLDNIRKKISGTGNLLVVLDACHSGTASREGDDDEYIRGTTYIFAPDNYPEPEVTSKNIKRQHQNAPNMSAITVLSACLPDEINYEYKINKEYYGILSYALSGILKNKPGKLTNKQFCETLKLSMQQLTANQKRKQTLYFETTDENKVFQIGR